MQWPLIFFFSIVVVAGQLTSYEGFHKKNLPKLLSLTHNSDKNVLLQFNTPRTPGSEESKHIQESIVGFFRDDLHHNWTIEQESFEANGYNFTNLVFSSQDAERYVIFAAHYDSKLKPKGFIGAMDSAASCGVLMYLAKFIDYVYDLERDLFDRTLLTPYLGVKIIFFDGEEALQEWSVQDSIYGAKALASRWAKDGTMDRIDLFVLMDLLGSNEHLPIPSYFSGSHFYYEMLSNLEDSYVGVKQGELKSLDPTNHGFLDLGRSVIDDDHLPFYAAGIDVLHLIPFPFPKTWHTIDDDFEHLGQKEIYKWATLICDFLISFAQLYD